jgi:peptide/nickel transport system substrate-binding protein
MTFHRLKTLGAMLALAAAYGCGGGSGTPAPTAAPPAETAISINATPRERLREGGTFTWAMEQMPVNFNRVQLDGSQLDGSYVMDALLPTTFDNDSNGAPLWNRNVLASEPTISTNGAQVVTYEINPKAAWYDGTPITWEDFYWQWKAQSGSDPAYRIVTTIGYENMRNVARGKDDREVIVTYAQPFADWQSMFTPFYPASTNKDPKIFNEGWVDRPLTTAGPFKFDSIDRTTQTITLVRNEKWWGTPAKLERLVFRAIDVNAQIDAFANGEVDSFDIGPDANRYKRAMTIDGAEVRVAGGPNFRHLTINGTGPILGDLRVRRALALAVDRSALARASLAPLGVAAEVLDNHIFMRNQQGYRDNAGDVGKYDPEQAARLLEEAGWTLQGNVRSKDGQRLEITCVIPAAVQVSRQESELVQNMLARVGFKVNIDTVPSNDFFEKYVNTGQFDITLFSWIGTPYPMSSAKSIYANPQKGPDGQLMVQQNYARIGNAEIDALFAQAGGEFDRPKALETANRVDALIWQEVHSLTLYQRPELIATKKWLANFGAFGLQTPWPYTDIGWVAKP